MVPPLVSNLCARQPSCATEHNGKTPQNTRDRQGKTGISRLGARQCGAYILDILLSVQQEAQDDTQEMFGAFGGRILLEVLFKLDRTEMC